MKLRKSVRKLTTLLIAIFMTFSLVLTGCAGPQDPTGSPSPSPSQSPPTDLSVTGIEVTNAETTIGAGDLAITAKCLPKGSNQGFTVSLDSAVFGVSLDDKTLKIHAGARTGDKVNVTVKSTEDATKTAKREFTLTIGEPQYERISTASQLKAIGADSASMAKNYILTGDIVLQNVDDEGTPSHMRWNPFSLPFTGLLDGNGYSVKGIDISTGSDIEGGGFFKVNNGVIRNIGFDNTGYLNDANYNYYMNLGANSGVIAGVNNGGIENVFTNVPLLAKNGTAGALVGTNNGFIYNSYAMGVAATNATGDEKAGVVGVNNGVISGVIADSETSKLTSFIGSAEDQNDDALNANLINSTDMQTAVTYTSRNWPDNAWYIADSSYALLKSEDFDPDNIEREIKITTPSIIEVGDYPAGTKLQLTLQRTNAALKTVVWSIDNPDDLPGVTIDEATGEVTFASIAGALDGKTLFVTATIEEDDVYNQAAFGLRDDGYNTNTGIVVSTAQELYNTFFSADSAKVARNITRTVKLANDIILPKSGDDAYLTMPSGGATANWRGIEKFFGVLDGQGYSIQGFDVVINNSSEVFRENQPVSGMPRYDGNAGWGFIRHLGDKTTNQRGVVKNLVLKNGTINYKERYTTLGGENRYIGGLAQYFDCGLIQNVLVDLNIHTISNYAGMVVGSMSGNNTVANARMEGSTRMESVIAMGEISSSLDPNSELRKEWEPYPCGALLGKTQSAGVELVNCYAMGEKTEDKNLTNRSDASLLEYISQIENTMFVSREDFQLKATFEGNGFDPDIWFYEDDHYPTLRYPGFVKPDPVPSIVTITNKGANVYDYLGVAAEGVQIETETINDKGNKVSYAINPSVPGVSVSNTGLITFESTVSDNASVTVEVSLGAGSQGDSYTFRIYNDGYNPALGIAVSNEVELYNTFFGENSARALNRKIVLTDDIVLSTYANWPMITGTFSGQFDGQGYEISGLKAKNPTELNGAGYAFFGKLKGSDAKIERVTLKGEIDWEVLNFDNLIVVGGLVQEMEGGTIQNVLVDIDIKTNAKFNGPVAAHMTGGKVLNCISLGTSADVDNPNAATGERPNWAPYAFGAFVGKVDGGATTVITNCFAMGVKTENLLGFTNRSDGDAELKGVTNSDFKTQAELQAGSAFENYDETIWNFTAGEYPSLIKPAQA